MKDITRYIHKGPRWDGQNWKPDLSRCRFSVYENDRAAKYHQCNRKAVETVEGYDFCKQHANQVKTGLGIRDDATKTKYAASFTDGEPHLVELEILGETDATIEIAVYKAVIGDSTYGLYNGRLRKDSRYTRQYGFFDDYNSALLWLYEKSGKYVNSMNNLYLDAVETRMKLEKMVATLEEL